MKLLMNFSVKLIIRMRVNLVGVNNNIEPF